MGKTSIEWTDATWNPITGCKEVSRGCANCYAARLAATRLRKLPEYDGLATFSENTRWTGEVRFHPERLNEPLHWRQPRKIFVCDMADLFFDTPWAWIHDVFSVMQRCPQHTFQILTKRAERMNALMSIPFLGGKVGKEWPLPNVWLGVSVESQHFADERIPLLLSTPAAVRWISAEPLLGPMDLTRCGDRGIRFERGFLAPNIETPESRMNWVVCGGESGPNARPMHPDWARSLRDQCVGGGVPFFFKQWGEWIHVSQIEAAMTVDQIKALSMDTPCRTNGPEIFFKVGKKRAGRLLDGREWNEFPKPAAVQP